MQLESPNDFQYDLNQQNEDYQKYLQSLFSNLLKQKKFTINGRNCTYEEEIQHSLTQRIGKTILNNYDKDTDRNIYQRQNIEIKFTDIVNKRAKNFEKYITNFEKKQGKPWFEIQENSTHIYDYNGNEKKYYQRQTVFDYIKDVLNNARYNTNSEINQLTDGSQERTLTATIQI